MKKGIIFLMCFIGCAVCNAGDGEYAVSKIPESLLKNAHAVKRTEEKRFEIKNAGEAFYTIKYALTILDENGDKYANLVVHYDRFNDIRSLDGTLYDAGGKELKHVKNKDIRDMSGVSDNNLMDDDRVKFHNFYYKVYPYTIEYAIEVKFNGTMFYPSWMPLEDENYSVQESHFVFVCPGNYKFRFKAGNYNGAPVITNEKEKQLYTWQVKNLTAITDETYAPFLKELTTEILFGPGEFEMQDYKGNMQTWEDLGKFIYALKQGKDDLPDNVKKTIHQLTDGENDTKQKIRKLYQYLQKNTRYVSIQLGIGGWQPYDAKYVASKGYGDCKALSNYMYSLLKEAGIPSYYTIIKAGDDEKDIQTDFPSSQFNHVIVCVPVNKDTVWLECTDQNKPAGYMGGFTGNRHALLITENGGKLVTTPKYGLKENFQERHIKAKLDEEGTLQITANSRYEAEQQDDVNGVINYLSKDKVKEYLHRHFDFGTYDITSFDYKENKSELPSVDEQLGISVSNYAAITGKRLFITPNVMTRSRRRLSENEERKYDIVLNYEFRDIDSVEIELPAGYEPEAKPQDVTISNKFGKYSSNVKLSGNKLYYYRSAEQYEGRYPAKDYKDLVTYFEAIYKADRAKVVLVKKE
jgi:Domain of Unknown Function with PDB structure (DUF3857)/Transglutaminase-like superfamily/Domain of Unknown Function with PDB structure (DUF3858)